MSPFLFACILVLNVVAASAQTVAGPAGSPPGQAPASPSPAATNGEYLIGPQDLLNIIVYGEPAPLTGRFRIDNDGTFPYQYLNRVKAEGLTTAQLEDALERALGDGYLRNPQVSVEVAEYRSQNVYVQGMVRSPGKYPVPGNASLMDAIFLAGSTLPEAGNWVEIYHGKTSAGPATSHVGARAADVRVRLTDVQSGKAQSIRINDGDTIFVPKAERIYVTGEVRAPGAYAYDDDMTIFTAISLAGGVTAKGSSTRITITRLVNGRRQEIDARQEDTLKPGDQVTVKPRRL